jgi:hypothetical protein
MDTVSLKTSRLPIVNSRRETPPKNTKTFLSRLSLGLKGGKTVLNLKVLKIQNAQIPIQYCFYTLLLHLKSISGISCRLFPYRLPFRDILLQTLRTSDAPVHCKQRLSFFPSPAGMPLTKPSLAGNN